MPLIALAPHTQRPQLLLAVPLLILAPPLLLLTASLTYTQHGNNIATLVRRLTIFWALHWANALAERRGTPSTRERTASARLAAARRAGRLSSARIWLLEARVCISAFVSQRAEGRGL